MEKQVLRSYDIFLSFYLIEQSKYVEIEIILHEIFPLKFQFQLSIRTRTKILLFCAVSRESCNAFTGVHVHYGTKSW